MDKTFLTLILLLSLVGVLISCQHSPSAYPSSLRYADSLVEISPDHILNYLGELNVSTYSKDDRIYFGLPLTWAASKGSLPFLPCDSLIDTILDYYVRKNGTHWARAWFYRRKIRRQMRVTEEALKGCFIALQGVEGNTREELKLKGMIYEDMGGIYLDQLLYQKASEEFYRSYQCDSLLNDERILMYFLPNMSRVHTIERKEEKVSFYSDQALRLASVLNDSISISDLYRHISLNCENVDSVFIYTRLAENYLTKRSDSTSLWLTSSELYSDGQKLDSAEHYLRRILSTSDLERKVLTSYSLAEVEQTRGNYQRTLEYQSYYGDNIDSILSSNYASGIERLVYKYDSEAKITKEEESRKVLTR